MYHQHHAAEVTITGSEICCLYFFYYSYAEVITALHAGYLEAMVVAVITD